MSVATVTSKGQVTIPADIRADFDIEPGDQLAFFKRLDGSLGVRVRRPRVGSGRGLFTAETGMTVSVEDMNRAVPERVDREFARSIGKSEGES